jgi:hypothetical protein
VLNLQSMAADAVAVGREAAESLMVDACTITRASTGAPVVNSNDGTLTPQAPVVVYTGKCRIQLPDTMDKPAETGGEYLSTQSALVSLPVTGSEAVTVGDVVTVTSSTLDVDLTGITYVVRGLHRKSHATARRLRCEEAN